MNPYRTLTTHTDWCAHNHRCNLAEHRSLEIRVNLPGRGRAVLTRVRTTSGSEHAEIRMTFPLPTEELAARSRLHALLADLHTLTGTTSTRAKRPRL